MRNPSSLQQALKKLHDHTAQLRGAKYGQLENAALCHAYTEMRDVLVTLVAQWESVDPNAPVPDEINNDLTWDRARQVLKEGIK